MAVCWGGGGRAVRFAGGCGGRTSRLEMIGGRQLYLERHLGILAYSDTQIDVNTAAGVLRVRGERLSLVAMTAEEVRIGGQINAVEWVR